MIRQPESPYRWVVFCVIALGTFMATLDGSIVNVALPYIADYLHINITLVQWVVTSYLLVISSLLPILGKVGDMFGRRIFYSSGFLVFIIGSFLCAISSGILFLILSRVLQAIGAAILMANSPAIIANAFPGKDRGRALGIAGTVVALGTMMGPGLGGILLSHFGWQSIFYINIPFGILGFILGFTLLPSKEELHLEKFDTYGAVLFAFGIFYFLLALSQGRIWGWFSLKIIASFIAACFCLILFYLREKKITYSMIDLSLFKNKTFSSASFAGMFSFMAIFSHMILLPFFLNDILKYTPTEIGLVILSFPLTLAVIAPVSGYLSEKISQRFLTTMGLFITMLSLLFFTTINSDTTKLHIILAQIMMGIGNGMFQSPNNNNIISSVPPNKLGIASGLNALMKNLGMIGGVAISVSVFEGVLNYSQKFTTSINYDSAFIFAYHSAIYLGVTFGVIGTIVSFRRECPECIVNN